MNRRSMFAGYAVVGSLLVISTGCDAPAVGQQKPAGNGAPPAVAAKPAGERNDTGKRLTVLCATNRVLTGTDDKRPRFGTKRGPLRYLRYDLTISADHKPGAIGDIAIKRVQPVPPLKRGKRKRSRKRGRMLVFVHGFYVGHDESIRRAAQVANELNYKGRVVAFSWPSLCKFDPKSYRADRKMLDESVPAFCQLLSDLSKQYPRDDIQVLAHSLAGRLVGEAAVRIRRKRDTANELICLANIIFASPDVGVTRFQTRYAKPLLRIARRITILHSTCDPLLKIAKSQNNGRPRLGRVGVEGDRFLRIESFDFSGLGCTYGTHNFYRRHPVLLKKLKGVLYGENRDIAGR